MIEYGMDHASSTSSSIAMTSWGPVALAGLFVAQLSVTPVVNQGPNIYKSLFKRDLYHSAATPPSYDQYRSIITGEYHQEHDQLKAVSSLQLNPFIEQLNYWVDSINLPSKWSVEGIDPPSFACRKLAKAIVIQLLKDYQLYPSRISATIEEGVFINYINHVNKLNLTIEAYNDLEVAAIITRDKEIIFSTDISNENLTEIIQIFNARKIS